MKFNYQARTKEGKLEAGAIEAYSKEAAAELLHKYNVFIVSIQEAKAPGMLWSKMEFYPSISKKELAVFFRQLSIMIESQVPVVQSLHSLAAQSRKKNFREALYKIAGSVEEGLPLSNAMASHPKLFDPFSINLIKSGEASGKVFNALKHVSAHIEQESDISAQLRQAMVYPVFIISFMGITIAVIALFLVPQIIQLVNQAGVTPSPIAAAVIAFYGFLGRYWWIGAIILAAGASFGAYYIRTKEGKKQWDVFSLRIPLIRDLLKKVFLVRFASNISTLLVAGVSINKALGIAQNTVNNTTYRNIVGEIEERVSEGEKMSAVMATHEDYFPPFVWQMVKIGEDTGKLDSVLTEIVNFYQKEIKRTIDLFAALIEPIVIIILGVTMTMIAISLLSSLYGVIGTL